MTPKVDFLLCQGPFSPGFFEVKTNNECSDIKNKHYQNLTKLFEIKSFEVVSRYRDPQLQMTKN